MPPWLACWPARRRGKYFCTESFMNIIVRTILLAVCLNLILTTHTFAGSPPFLTDDPEPVDYQHGEAYLFTLGEHFRGGYAIKGPAGELNYGVLLDTQLHLIVPMSTVGGSAAPTVSGLGDTEIGIKYRFVHETNGWPQIGFLPMVELPTGDADRSLGNGRAWFRLPLWLQKSWGPWTAAPDCRTWTRSHGSRFSTSGNDCPHFAVKTNLPKGFRCRSVRSRSFRASGSLAGSALYPMAMAVQASKCSGIW